MLKLFVYVCQCVGFVSMSVSICMLRCCLFHTQVQKCHQEPRKYRLSPAARTVIDDAIHDYESSRYNSKERSEKDVWGKAIGQLLAVVRDLHILENAISTANAQRDGPLPLDIDEGTASRAVRIMDHFIKVKRALFARAGVTEKPVHRFSDAKV